jgi:hypothetical protein
MIHLEEKMKVVKDKENLPKEGKRKLWIGNGKKFKD